MRFNDVQDTRKAEVRKEQRDAAVITHAAFYSGWPKAWAAFRMAKEVYEAN